MEPKPVTEHPAPAYPTRREFLETGAAAALLAAGGGCGGAAGSHPLVAPIFEHGEGRGSMGCVVVSPPVFLSEEEALQVIKEELAKVGIQLGAGKELTEVTVQYVDPWFRSNDGDRWFGETLVPDTGKASLAGVDAENQVGVEVVTAKYCDRFAGGLASTVFSYETKELAKQVGAAIRAQGQENLRIGLFYDPLVTIDFRAVLDAPPDERRGENAPQTQAVNAAEEPDERNVKHWEQLFERRTTSARNEAKDQLRRQARDFVAWLKQHPQRG